MVKYIVYALCVYLYSISAWSQENSIEIILQNIENNNRELSSYQELLKSHSLEMLSENNLPDPVVGGYYLPWGDHNTGNYSEFQFTQSFEFPSVYSTRKDLFRERQQLLDLEYQLKRKEILLKAKKYVFNIIYLNRLIRLEEERSEQAQLILKQMQQLFDKEQVGILELNKAKISWLQEQFQVEQLKNDKQNILLKIVNLNGGQEIEVSLDEYPETLDLLDPEEIWQEKLSNDAALNILNKQEQVARKQVSLARSKNLPNLTAGFNYQGVAQSNYYGLFGGLTIPLWSNRNKVKAAEIYYQYQQALTDARLLAAEAEFLKQFNNYEVMLKKLTEYRQTLNSLQGEDLLLKAYNLGEISFMEYYFELQFYRNAINSMLEIENELYILKSEILKHQL